MAGFISQESIDSVRKKSSIVTIVGEYVQLVQRGTEWWGCCPFHTEKTPSFHVIPDKNVYYCFGCHAGGDAIKFIMEMEKLSYPDAVRFLAKRYGVELQSVEGYEEKNATDAKEKDTVINLYNRVASLFHYLMTQEAGGKFALDYIVGRGLTMETIVKFKLGYSPADRHWLKKFLRNKNFSDEFLDKSGLFSKKYPDTAFFSDRLMFPIFDRRGDVVAFGGRLLRGDGPKYLNSGDLLQYQKGETLYAFNFAKQSIRLKKCVIFCEGYMDCIAYHQCNINYAVAPLGTALTDEQVKLIRGFADTVCLSFDSDGAGKAATKKAILLCRKHDLTVKIVRLQGGKDPAEIMVNFGPETLTNAVNNAIIDTDYLLSELSQEFPVDTPEGKTKASLAFFPYIDALRSDIQKESCLELLCQTFNLSPEAVRRDFNNRDQARTRVEALRQSADQKPGFVQPVKITAELRSLLAVIADTDQFELMRRELNENDFENSLAKDLFIILEECYRFGDLSPGTILGHCQDNRLQQLIIQSAASGEFTENTAQTVQDSIKLIKGNSLERRRSLIMNRIRMVKPVTPEDEKLLKDLLSEKMDIDQILLQLKD
jgi:DNA primase